MRAIIAPHAGYSYSGSTAAYSYACIDAASVKRVYLLGPSHHEYLAKAGLSQAGALQTPLDDLAVDVAEVRALAKESALFSMVGHDVDEAEHSIEMHLPILVRVFQRQRQPLPQVVPIMIGSFALDFEKRLGALLAPKLSEAGNFFIVSSDFCHFGARFSFTLPVDNKVPLHQTIEALDRRGAALIENQDLDGFAAYLAETRNTICGRHPISVFLAALKASRAEANIRLLRYAQSSQCTSLRDSSVSYASFAVTCIYD